MPARYATIFVDIDTQHDFMDPRGALYVPGAEQIIPNLKRLLAVAIEHRIPVVSTADHHAPDDPEFSTYGFPAHCVAGTPGAQRLPYTLLADRAILDPDESAPSLPALLTRHSQVIFRKRMLDIWTSVAASQLLEQVEAGAWYVFGVATDYCVKSAALGLAKAGQPTYVVTDAVRAITAEGEKTAMDEMQAAGVRFATTEQVLERLKTRQLQEKEPRP
jgi:nicotinamidase/pyrazinamidase